MADQLNDNQVLDLRAKERTLDGAYFRTSIGLMGASLLALRLFDKELRLIGLVFITFGISMFIIDIIRRYHLKEFQYSYIEDEEDKDKELKKSLFLKYFYTSGNLVFATSLLAILAYTAVIFILLWGRRG
ncbi:hypothetical protein K502DRAFT_324576 [Neoconidiobolus thromboides FSU 785]|nr:hypothetical protein K502DRAFT_324576 [Neoconidiobolus thromboides FSU 785]